MPRNNHILRFDRPLLDVVCAASAQRFDSAEVARREEEAFERGKQAQRTFSDSQVAELRGDAQSLQHGLFARLQEIESAFFHRIQADLPDIVMDVARRLLHGYQPSEEEALRICRASLEELAPERENLELVVSEADAAALERLLPEWQREFPRLHIRIDSGLASGECLVISRFGIIDNRRVTRLDSLADELNATRRAG